MAAASVMPCGTLAKKDTISRTSEHSGIRISPMKNMWIAKPALGAADRLAVLGAVEELLVDDAAVVDEVAHAEEAPGDRTRLDDDEHGDGERQESVGLHRFPPVDAVSCDVRSVRGMSLRHEHPPRRRAGQWFCRARFD